MEKKNSYKNKKDQKLPGLFVDYIKPRKWKEKIRSRHSSGHPLNHRSSLYLQV